MSIGTSINQGISRYTHTHCECGSAEHQLTWEFEPGVAQQAEDGIRTEFPPRLVITTYLNHYLPWYKRLWVGIKYIFGIVSNEEGIYNQFDCTVLGIEDALQVKDLLRRFELEYDSFYEQQRNLLVKQK